MKYSTIILLFFWTALFSCNQEEITRGTPQCLLDKIDGLRTDSNAFIERVYQYRLGNETIYYFETTQCCDIPSIAYDENCKSICASGGIAGNLGPRCEEFFKNRKDEKLIWQK